MTVDVHTHFVPRAIFDVLKSRSLPPFVRDVTDIGGRFFLPVGNFDYDLAAYCDAAARVAFLDENKVDGQLLSMPGLFGTDSLPVDEAMPLCRMFNDEAAQIVAARPDRFAALASLPFADMDAAIAEYKRARTELGLIGAIVSVNYFEHRDAVTPLEPLLAEMNRVGGHLFLHPGPRPDQRWDLADKAPPPYRDNLLFRAQFDVQNRVSQSMVTMLFTDALDAYPNITVHNCNGGGTLAAVIERIDHMVAIRQPDDAAPSSRIGRFHVDCSSLGPRMIEMVAGFVGEDRVLFGSDNPVLRTDWTLGAVASMNISAAAKQKILHDNAAALLAPLWPQIA